MRNRFKEAGLFQRTLLLSGGAAFAVLSVLGQYGSPSSVDAQTIPGGTIPTETPTSAEVPLSDIEDLLTIFVTNIEGNPDSSLTAHILRSFPWGEDEVDTGSFVNGGGQLPINLLYGGSLSADLVGTNASLIDLQLDIGDKNTLLGFEVESSEPAIRADIGFTTTSNMSYNPESVIVYDEEESVQAAGVGSDLSSRVTRSTLSLNVPSQGIELVVQGAEYGARLALVEGGQVSSASQIPSTAVELSLSENDPDGAVVTVTRNGVQTSANLLPEQISGKTVLAHFPLNEQPYLTLDLDGNGTIDQTIVIGDDERSTPTPTSPVNSKPTPTETSPDATSTPTPTKEPEPDGQVNEIFLPIVVR